MVLQKLLRVPPFILCFVVSTNHSMANFVYQKDKFQGKNFLSPTSSEHPYLTVVDSSEDKDGSYLVFEKGENPKLLVGTLLDVYREKQRMSVLVGSAKIISQTRGRYVAKVKVDGTDNSKRMIPDYPNIMVGDRAIPRRKEIDRTIFISPTKVIPYNRVFADPYAFPNTFELTLNGKKAIEKAIQPFLSPKLPLLIVEAHTDADGEKDTNQIDSYKRAITIRQHLSDELEFDPDRVIAIGMGEIEPIDEPYLPGAKDKARRIVFKAKAKRN